MSAFISGVVIDEKTLAQQIRAELAAVAISMEADCLTPECDELAVRTHAQLSSGNYTWPCSVMPLPDTIEEWDGEHRTARKRAGRAQGDGYTFARINREDHEDAMFAINTSAESRQGRPMSDGYRTRPTFPPLPDYPCDRHAIRTYGVLDTAGTLRAYTVIHRVGELVMVSQILGHAKHLERHVMYLLVRGMLAAQISAGSGLVFYNRHDSGTDGLRFFKERLGFAPARIDWQLA